MYKVIMMLILILPLAANAWHEMDIIKQNCTSTKDLAFYCDGDSQKKETHTINKTTDGTKNLLSSYSHQLCVYVIENEVTADYSFIKKSPLLSEPQNTEKKFLTLAEDQDVSPGRMTFHFQTMHKNLWGLDQIEFEFDLDTYSEMARVYYSEKGDIDQAVISTLSCRDLRD